MSKLRLEFGEMLELKKALDGIEEQYGKVKFPSSLFLDLGYPMIVEALKSFSEAGDERVDVLEEWCDETSNAVLNALFIPFRTDEEWASQFKKLKKQIYK